ncbi:MAG TPA: response regulator transcription factor [Chroococcales cyanobacterium]
MAKIFLADDDRSLCTMIVDWLGAQHFNVECAHNVTDAHEFLKSYKYDLVILDWSMPDGTGLDVLKAYRHAGGKTPVLMLTGKSGIDEKEEGLDSGADDYLTKPFHVKELLARVRALLRRPDNFSDNVLRFGPITLDPTRFEVRKNDKELKLYPKEFALMEFFMRHPNTVFSAQALLDHVWSADAAAGGETIRTAIRRLRMQIDDEGEPSLIENVHGVGYRLKERQK